MIKNKVESVQSAVVRDCLERILQGHQEVELNQTQWMNETMGEDTLAINQDVRNVYFGLKHIILKEIDTSD